MSADDQIYIQQNSKGRWVAQHCSASGGPGDPDKVPFAATYPTMERAIEMNHDRARQTEYGFTFSETAYATIQSENKKQEVFREELQALINRHSKENGSGTPDYILAEFLDAQLTLFDKTIADRATHRGELLEDLRRIGVRT